MRTGPAGSSAMSSASADFMLTHPEKVRSTSLKYAEVIRSKFAAAWRSKVTAVSDPDFCVPNQGCLDAAL